MEVLSCKAGFHCSYIILTYMYSLHFCLVLWHGYHRKYILCAWIKQSISCCRSWFFSNEQCIFPRCTVFIQNMFAFNEGECILVVMFFFCENQSRGVDDVPWVLTGMLKDLRVWLPSWTGWHRWSWFHVKTIYNWAIVGFFYSGSVNCIAQQFLAWWFLKTPSLNSTFTNEFQVYITK